MCERVTVEGKWCFYQCPYLVKPKDIFGGDSFRCTHLNEDLDYYDGPLCYCKDPKELTIEEAKKIVAKDKEND